jgi:formylglycine-generating enzyme required for sulfatase activity
MITSMTCSSIGIRIAGVCAGVCVCVLCLAACSVELDRFSRRDTRPGDGTAAVADASIPGTWVRVPPGTFAMGSPTGEPCRNNDEDQHQVTLTRAFLIMSSEVTRQQFQEVMGSDPSEHEGCSDCPVENVTWHQAAAYCNALSARAGLEACYACSGSGSATSCSLASAEPYACAGYRLPTEAEWERSYRAGTTTAFHGVPVTTCSGIDAGLDLIAWYKENSGGATHPVATRQPNAWGIYDMAGNVLEWVNDRYLDSLGTSAVTDPVGPASGVNRVQRGGSYDFRAGVARAAARMSTRPGEHYGDFGFRAARTE